MINIMKLINEKFKSLKKIAFTGSYNDLNNRPNLPDNIITKNGYYGENGTSTQWTVSSQYPKMYRYNYTFPVIAGYTLLIGFCEIAWTSSNNYFDYLIKNTICDKTGYIEMYSKEGTPTCVLKFIGIYMKTEGVK